MIPGPCPCGRSTSFGPAPYESCCGRYLDHPDVAAPDPDSLMRSRYTAYALGRERYLLDTWDASTRPERLDLEPEDRLRWHDLTVTSSSTDGDRGEVSFEARWSRPEGSGVMRERSRFVRRDGRWSYVDGRSGTGDQR